MDLVKSWGVGVAVWILGSLLSSGLIINFAQLSTFRSVGGRVLVDYLPSFIVLACVAAAAALVHPDPSRRDAGRHAAAAFAVPGVSLVASFVFIAVDGPAVDGTATEVVVATIAASVAGAVLGWRLADTARPPRQARPVRYY